MPMPSRPTIRLTPAPPPSAVVPPAARPPLALRSLLLAPHRYAFFAGTCMLLAVSLAWTLLLAAALLRVPVATALPPTLAHGFIFAAAYMPLFMAGFLYTAGPRWLDMPAPQAALLRWPIRLHASGIALLLAGTATASAAAAFGALLLAMAWTAVGAVFASLLRASRVRDRLHARWVLVFWIASIAAALLFTAGLATRQYAMVGAAAWLLIAGGLLPITVTVAHRVLPVFTSNAVLGPVPWRANGVLLVLLAAMLSLGALQIAVRSGFADARTVAWLTLATQAPAAAAATVIAIRWGLLQSLAKASLRLVAMLHLAFAWIPLGFALGCIDAALLLAAPDAPRLGAMPLHALTMGFLGSMLFAMATRIVSGHGGVPMVVDNAIWSLFWLLQIATLLRLAAALGGASSAMLAAAAAALWTLAWAGWALRYLPVLLRPRADGRPG